MKLLKLSILSAITLLSLGCGGGGGSSDTKSQGTDTINTNTTDDTNSSPIDTTNTNSDALLKASLNISKLNIDVQSNSLGTSTKIIKNLNSTISSLTNMNIAVMNTLDNGLKFTNAMAQEFDTASDYKNVFSLNTNYDAVTPAFSIVASSNINYLLLSSNTKFFIEGETTRKYFKDATTLSKAWSNTIDAANKSKDLYLCLVEVADNGVVTQVTNSLLIKSATLQNY